MANVNEVDVTWESDVKWEGGWYGCDMGGWHACDGGRLCWYIPLTSCMKWDSFVGPSVALDKSCVSFGRVESGQRSSATLRITNSSSARTVFQVTSWLACHICLLLCLVSGDAFVQFLLDPEGVFHTDVISGQLGGGESQLIAFYFTPPKPIPYHKRVTCLLLHQVTHPPIHWQTNIRIYSDILLITSFMCILVHAMHIKHDFCNTHFLNP